MKILVLVALILGCFTGAGFVSGREISAYFSIFGFNAIFGTVVTTMLFAVLIYMFFKLSYVADSFVAFVKIYYGRFSSFINFMFAICILIIASSMFAANSIIAMSINIDKILFAIIVATLTFLSVIGGKNSLGKINLVVMPIMLVVIIVVCFEKQIYMGEINRTLVVSMLSGINYVFINIVTLGLFILEIGKSYTQKQKIIASIVSSLIIGIMIFIINNAIILGGVIDSAMPMLVLALNKSKALWIVTLIAIFFGIFTTLVSCIFMLCNYINTYVKNRSYSIIIALSLAIVISNFGFGFIVNYIYSIIGFLGLVFVLKLFFTKKEFVKTNIKQIN